MLLQVNRSNGRNSKCRKIIIIKRDYRNICGNSLTNFMKTAENTERMVIAGADNGSSFRMLSEDSFDSSSPRAKAVILFNNG